MAQTKGWNGNEFRAPARVRSGVVTLLDGSTISLDASLGGKFIVSLTGDHQILAPTNPDSGQTICIEAYAQSGARVLSLDTGTGGFASSNGISTTIPSIASGTFILLWAHYSTRNSKWNLVGFENGMS